MAQLWQEASDTAFERMEREADRRGLEGYEKAVWYKGEKVGTVNRFSDNLLMFRMKALHPEHRDTAPVTVNTGPVQYNINEWDTILTRLVALLAPHPEIRDAVVRMLDAETATEALQRAPALEAGG